MKRGTPLKRRTPLRNRRPIARRNGRARDIDYMLLVRTMPCCAKGVAGHRCEGPREADHAGERPLGRKADDTTVIPLCRLGHRQRTDFSGPFKGWSREAMRAWLDFQIAMTQRRLAALRARTAKDAAR